MDNRRYQLHPAPVYPKWVNYPCDELSYYLPHLKLKAPGHKKMFILFISFQRKLDVFQYRKREAYILIVFFSVSSHTDMWLFGYSHLSLMCMATLSNNNSPHSPASEEAVRDSTLVIIWFPLFWEHKQVAHCLYHGIFNKITGFVPCLKDPNLGYVID